ncbi:DNA methyltransferase [Listeria monocytogenes]|uniref:DNA methyltransferase n=1 Tax=Listeria monocytogenes TaxID=1639 RepID=UPI0017731E27|nr:DNA methyltransferase [Listeria monocytogenes]MDA5983907.1 site-specific DNA-methyltransferase [Listeria monocytogenes]HAB7537447.1 site-specific DNA-methyltransferase [Listeria monocytogenes]
MAKIEPRIFDELKTVLSSFDGKYFLGEELNRSKLTDDLRNYDEALLSKLFEVDFIKQHFIKEVAGQKLFQIEHLEESVLYNDYWDTSYTKYENRVGLASKGKFLQDSQDVVLDFPFKDGVLTASMTKEDNEDGYDDAFLNEVIEKDEIDRLFDKKVFVNVKRFGDNLTAQEDNDIVSFDKEKDNLIIKGNNLLALHTIKEQYAGKVKLIYLDPPYNTGNDSFLYNDKFNHSTWLTFMKSRLEIAKELLSEDGVLAVQLDDSEGPYLKVLLDSIFERDSHLFTQYVLVRYAEKTLKSDMDYHKQVEQIHYYKKSTSSAVAPNKKSEDYDYSKFVYEFEELGEPERTIELGGKRIDVFNREQIKIKKVLPSINGLKEIWATGSILDGNSSGRFFRDYLSGRYSRDGYGVVYRIWGIGDDGNDFRYFTGPQKEGATKGKYFQGVPSNVKSGEVTTKFKPVAGFLDLAGSFGNIRHEGGVELRSGKKPEKMLSEIIQLYTKPSDIVLDFFGGSGSTAATAHKLGRRYISIEQIESQMEKILTRLVNVINGDSTGISNEIDWHGGGSFVYAELFPKNIGYLQDIIHSNTIEELKSVYERMLKGTDTDEPADISFRADLSKIDWTEGFDKNKRLLVKVLDKNGLYYNYSEIDDINVRDLISDEDYAFNKAFYEGGE